MRDPEASVRFEGARVLRDLRQPLPAEHFLRSGLARHWVDQGGLIPFEIEDSSTVAAHRLPFVSYPYEWCDLQLYRAAELTLDLQREAVTSAYDLKDASAWNVLFHGTRPVFCDLLSFAPLRMRRWWAFGQFARHFLLPLVVAKRRGLRAHQAFLAWRDGMPPAVARQMLGPARFLSRYWPLVAEYFGEDAASAAVAASAERYDAQNIARFRSGLHTATEWMLEGSKPNTTKDAASKRAWSVYTGHRGHYDQGSVDTKRASVSEWLARIKPEWVADLGCNTGEFSLIALAHGAHVVAIDADHDSVQDAFCRVTEGATLYPVVAPLDDIAGGRGWAGSEHQGLATRLEQRFDAVLMLALIHHLCVAAGIPLDAVAAFAARCTRQWLIVELIDESDPQLRLLCAQRQREPSEFSLSRQRDAFLRAGFSVQSEVHLGTPGRALVLLRKV